MQTHHYLAIILALVVGYVASRYFPQPAHALGLP